MNNNLLPLNLLNLTKSSTLHNFLHTSNSLINTVNNIIPLYTNIKPVINNVKVIGKALKGIKSSDSSNVDSNLIKKETTYINNQAKKDISNKDNSISFFQ